MTLQFSADRLQNIYKDWSVKLHADGQWADGPLFSNEQFGMGGVAGVRGYTDGEAYGDTGWRLSIEPQTPLINIGMVNSLYAVYENAQSGFAERYLAMLSAGGTKHYSELLKPFGLDAKDPKFWDGGLSVIAGMIDELESMS